MKKINWKLVIISILFATYLVLCCGVISNANSKYNLTDEQIALCEKYGEEYAICPELLEAMIFVESSADMRAKNGSCYGILQINGDIWGYDYDTEEKQIAKACELLISYLDDIPDIAYALDRYQGNSKALSNFEQGIISDYAQKVLDISRELEGERGKLEW